MIFNILLNFI